MDVNLQVQQQNVEVMEAEVKFPISKLLLILIKYIPIIQMSIMILNNILCPCIGTLNIDQENKMKTKKSKKNKGNK